MSATCCVYHATGGPEKIACGPDTFTGHGSRAAVLADVMREAGVSALGPYHLVEGELYVRQPRFTHEELEAIWHALPERRGSHVASALVKLDGYMKIHHALRRSLVRNGE